MSISGVEVLAAFWVYLLHLGLHTPKFLLPSEGCQGITEWFRLEKICKITEFNYDS